jgi:hypothetical protein
MSGRSRKKIGKIPGHTHEAKQAKIDGVELSTKQKERSQGKGQAFIKMHRQIYYVDADRPRYLESLKVVPVRGVGTRRAVRARRGA